MHYAVEPALVSKIREDYIKGNGSLREVAERHGVGEDLHTLEVRSAKEKWRLKREEHLRAIEEKGLDKAKNEAVEWEGEVRKSCKKNWLLVERSIDGIGTEIDPEAIIGFVRTQKILDDMARRSLGLVDPAVKLDITSAGKSLGDSFVDALAKLRASPLPAPTSEEVDRILECEIVEESNEGV